MTETRERYEAGSATDPSAALADLLLAFYAAGLRDGYRHSHGLVDITCPPNMTDGTWRCTVTCACGQTFHGKNWLPGVAIQSAIAGWQRHRDSQNALAVAGERTPTLQFRPIGRDLYTVTSPLTGAEHRLHVNGRVRCSCPHYAERQRCEHADALAVQLAQAPRCVNCGQLDEPWDRVTLVREYDAERGEWHPVHRCADRDACQRRRDEGARAFLARYGLAVGVSNA